MANLGKEGINRQRKSVVDLEPAGQRSHREGDGQGTEDMGGERVFTEQMEVHVRGNIQKENKGGNQERLKHGPQGNKGRVVCMVGYTQGQGLPSVTVPSGEKSQGQPCQFYLQRTHSPGGTAQCLEAPLPPRWSHWLPLYRRSPHLGTSPAHRCR